MKALVLKEYKRFAYEDVPTPEPGPDEVIIAVKACGICGSDVHGMDGSTGRRRPPIIMGHEAAGVVARSGAAVTDWSPGDRVTFDSTLYCGRCDFCRRGLINLCDNRRVLGVSCEAYRQHGAFADFVAVPQRILYRLPDGLPFEEAALAEPFAVALHAISRIFQPGGSSRHESAPTFPAAPACQKLEPAHAGCFGVVVVVGAGMIGLALVQGLRQAGCTRIIAVDVADERLALAGKFGATHLVHSARENALEVILGLTAGRGADLAFEAVGITPTVDVALGCLRKGGALTLVGNVAPRIEFALQAAVTREITIFGSCASRGEYPACLDMLARGELQAGPLLSAAAPLAGGAAWFERLYRKEPGLLKVVLQP